MLLQTAAFFSALGFVTWVVGELFDYPEVIAIGAVIIVGFGIMLGAGGVEQRVGTVEETNATTNTTTIEPQYETVSTPDRLPFSELITLLGGVGMLRSLNKFS